MTRKQALHKAVQALSEMGENREVISILQEISKELPLIHWSDSSIRDTIEQFILDNGRAPTASDFKLKGMPPHTVIKQKYKITLAEWLDKNYTIYRPTLEELRAKNITAFVNEYNKIKPVSAEQYNKQRNKSAPVWQTVANYYNIKAWGKLVDILNLEKYKGAKRKGKGVKFSVNFSFSDGFLNS